MFRQFACAALVLAAGIGIAVAEPVTGRITAITGDKVTVTLAPKVKGEKGESKTYDLGKNLKVMKMVDKDKTEALADGLKADEFKKLGEKGPRAVLEVNDNVVTQITLTAKKKKE